MRGRWREIFEKIIARRTCFGRTSILYYYFRITRSRILHPAKRTSRFYTCTPRRRKEELRKTAGISKGPFFRNPRSPPRCITFYLARCYSRICGKGKSTFESDQSGSTLRTPMRNFHVYDRYDALYAPRRSRRTLCSGKVRATRFDLHTNNVAARKSRPSWQMGAN